MSIRWVSGVYVQRYGYCPVRVGSARRFTVFTRSEGLGEGRGRGKVSK